MPPTTIPTPSVTTSNSSALQSVDLTPEQSHTIYQWLDSLPLSRPKKNIQRDFSDACLLAETIHHTLVVPNLPHSKNYVELHNYTPSSSREHKVLNWKTLNTKVLKKQFALNLSANDIESIVACKPQMIEKVLWLIYTNLQEREAAVKRQQELSLQQQQQPADTSATTSDHRIIQQHELTIKQQQQQIDILQQKCIKLEQLLQLKNTKILQLEARLQQ